ncbi:hypothetical protein CRUP_025808 [Coryphaenoides rupestris]|nr:hypothetical protein CRUP_025808 [Coryphaenoides rupestris]
MDTQGPPGASESEHSSQAGAQGPAPPVTQEARIPSEPPVQLKSQKKKKSGKKKKTTESPKSQENTSPSEGDQDPELTAESNLQRELDWCMEKLELGLKTQKGTPKQKDDASRALKVLRSGKAPLAKKRQVMRAMTGDYRRKMAVEKEKQLKLLQSEMVSLQVKAVSGSSKKKSVFHRRAQTHVVNTGEESKPQPLASTSDHMLSDNKTSQFVFTPSKEEFKFNFV